MSSPLLAAPLSPSSISAESELVAMGFDSASCRIAVALHRGNLSSATTFLLSEDSARWISAWQQLESIGFDATSIKLALEAKKGNVDAAMEWILRAEDRAAEPINRPSEPAAPIELVTAQYSDEQVRSDLLVHRSVFSHDLAALSEYCKRGLVDGRDHRGRTPLLLAHALVREDLVAFLLNRGADPRLKTIRGWSLFQQACMMQQRAVAMDVHLHSLMLKQKEWEQSQKQLLASLAAMPDFTLSIDWEIKSWLPLVGRFAPKDSFSIWKRGSALRLDSNVRGMNGMHVERGLMSYLFTRGSVFMVDHVSKRYSDALAEFRQPDYDEMQAHVAWNMQKDSASRSEINTDSVEFHAAKTLLRSQKMETVGQFKCRVVQMVGLKFIEIKTAKEDASAGASGSAAAAGAAASVPVSSGGVAVPAASSSSSSSSSKPAADSSLNASTYFDATEMAAYNTRRRKLERRERKKQRRMDEAFGELDSKQKAAAASAEGSSSSSAAASPALATPAAGAASSSRKSSSSSSSAHPSDDDSSDDDDVAASSSSSPAAAAVDDGLLVKTTSVDATLCLTPDFPLPLSHLLVLLDLLSPASSNLAKLRDILAVQLPVESDGRASFPVRLTFPLMSQVNACVTFSNYQRKSEGDIAEDVFAIPKEFTERHR